MADFRASGAPHNKPAPNEPHARAQPVQNSPGTPKNTEIRPFLASRENFLPVPPPRNRAGRTFSRFQHQSTTHPVQNSPRNTHLKAHPVQNSPSTPTINEIRPFQARRENFLPVPPPRHRAGRTFSRFQHHLGAYFNAADRLVPTFTRAPDQCAPKLGIVRVIGCSSRCSSRTRRDGSEVSRLELAPAPTDQFAATRFQSKRDRRKAHHPQASFQPRVIHRLMRRA